ncbi:glycoside hydrolase family 27 protein [Paenibacillus sonchi]|uniref:Alpha-galactosidase n=1 Tax=Paenibacillus sonchi TaxID=373687 RepID=A0A974P848_9BACL|nr:glycoside hydrolase family 27 protein [Paenibacillus sonchi]QQZ58671.1 glycoside hydrolase family 27 protein [Paenibacillus sonchi]
MAKRIGISLLLFMMVAVQSGVAGTTRNVAEAADKSLAQKPYMGWSSYSMQVYDPSGSWISAESIKKQSDAMHEKLQKHGYEYINIDAGWNGGMDEYGRPLPNTERYPDGFQEVIDYVHNNGQKIGIYLIPGLSIEAYNNDLEIYGTNGECRVRDIAVQPLKIMDYWNSYTYKIDFSNPCAQKYIDSIADLLGEWGIDFLKFDSVTPGSGINNLSRDARGDVEAWSKALARHDIWFELSWALDHNYVDFWKKFANGWRIQWDVESYDSNIGLTQWANIARLFPDAAIWWRDAGPGGWNDFDSLNVGNGAMDGLTKDERKTAMTFWAVSAAQLYLGNDMTRLDDYGLELLTNDEVIAVNQAGHPAHPLSMDTQQQVWYANNGDGTYNVALFNLGSRSAAVDVKWSDIGLAGPASVRDLWSHSELGTFDTGFSGGCWNPMLPGCSR